MFISCLLPVCVVGSCTLPASEGGSGAPTASEVGSGGLAVQTEMTTYLGTIIDRLQWPDKQLQ